MLVAGSLGAIAACGGTSVPPSARTVHPSAQVQGDGPVAASPVQRIFGATLRVSIKDDISVRPIVGCYCLYAVATHDLHDSQLEWTGPPSVGASDEVLLVAEQAHYDCAFIGGAGRPVPLSATRVGNDVVVVVNFDFSGTARPAEIVPAPLAGGHVLLEVHGNIMMPGGADHVERCDVPVNGG